MFLQSDFFFRDGSTYFESEKERLVLRALLYIYGVLCIKVSHSSPFALYIVKNNKYLKKLAKINYLKK